MVAGALRLRRGERTFPVGGKSISIKATWRKKEKENRKLRYWLCSHQMQQLCGEKKRHFLIIFYTLVVIIIIGWKRWETISDFRTIVAFRLESGPLVNDMRADAVMDVPLPALPDDLILRLVGHQRKSRVRWWWCHEIGGPEILFVHKELVVAGSVMNLESRSFPMLGR